MFIPLFKQFTCACVASYNETTYDANIANIDPLGSNVPSDYQNVRNYLASYTNIGVYDPNMFEAGRKLRRQGYPEATIKLIMTVFRDSTKKQYTVYLKKWPFFCLRNKIS